MTRGRYILPQKGGCLRAGVKLAQLLNCAVGVGVVGVDGPAT